MLIFYILLFIINRHKMTIKTLIFNKIYLLIIT